MKNVSVRLPDEIHALLVEYQAKEKSHLSRNGIIVEAIADRVAKDRSIERRDSGSRDSGSRGGEHRGVELQSAIERTENPA